MAFGFLGAAVCEARAAPLLFVLVAAGVVLGAKYVAPDLFGDSCLVCAILLENGICMGDDAFLLSMHVQKPPGDWTQYDPLEQSPRQGSLGGKPWQNEDARASVQSKQIPPMHSLLQHSLLDEHPTPTGLHAGGLFGLAGARLSAGGGSVFLTRRLQTIFIWDRVHSGASLLGVATASVTQAMRMFNVCMLAYMARCYG